MGRSWSKDDGIPANKDMEVAKEIKENVVTYLYVSHIIHSLRFSKFSSSAPSPRHIHKGILQRSRRAREQRVLVRLCGKRLVWFVDRTFWLRIFWRVCGRCIGRPGDKDVSSRPVNRVCEVEHGWFILVEWCLVRGRGRRQVCRKAGTSGIRN